MKTDVRQEHTLFILVSKRMAITFPFVDIDGIELDLLGFVLFLQPT